MTRPSRGEIDLMQRQAVGGEVLSEQAEAAARIDDHQAAAVNCHGLHGEVIQGRRLARAGGAEHQQMGVLLAVGAIERVKEEGRSPPRFHSQKPGWPVPRERP